MRLPSGFTLSLRRLLILLSAIGLLPLAVLGLWSLHTASGYQQREQDRAMLDQVRALSSAVDAELDGTVAALASLARAAAMAAGDLKAFYDSAREQAAAHPEWLAIVLTDASGKILFRTASPFSTPGGRIADPESLQRLLAVQRPLVGQVARGTGGLGLGLGLAIVRKIVELHEGRMTAHSEGPGTGSRFVVELPLIEAQQPMAAPVAPPRSARTGVLLIDDNVDAAATTAMVLEQFGHEVHVAHTAAAALASYERHRPAVAILDIGLPDMDGYALAAAIRRTGAKPRLVALTGYGQQADVERALDAGFDLHLTKPASLDDLERAVAGSANATT
jgi:CheY-like chemotaxis protein